MTQHEWAKFHPLGWKCSNCGLVYKTEFKRDKPRIGKFFAYNGGVGPYRIRTPFFNWDMNLGLSTVTETCEEWLASLVHDS